jgi:branched-chain amino acid transport system permease protein
MIVMILNGLAFGVLLMVLASGLAMIFGLRDVVNFAHGALYMLGAYVGLTVSNLAGFWVALIVTPIVFAILGIVLDRYGIRYLGDRDHTETILITYGLTFVLTGLVQVVWGTASRTLSPPPLLDGSVHIAGSTYPSYRLFVIVVGLAICSALGLWLRKSRTGLYVRASSTHRDVAAVVGIDVDKVSATVVGVGLALAGVAGVMAGPYLSLSPNMGVEILVLTFIVVVTGGLGSIGGAMAAALVLGMLNAISSTYLPGFAAYVPYSLMLAVLIFRPRGIAGTRVA